MVEKLESKSNVNKMEDKIEHLDQKISSIGKTLSMLIDCINGYQGSVVENNILIRGCLREAGVRDKDMPMAIGKREQVLELYNKGASISAIAKIVGVSRQTVYNYIGDK